MHAARWTIALTRANADRPGCPRRERMPLPFGPQFVSDIVNRTHTAQDPDECLLAAQLVIEAQNKAKWVTLKA